MFRRENGADDGGAYANAEMGGLRWHQWFVWEGGIRVSWLAAWKGRIPAGRVSHEPMIQFDVLPTALAAAGAEVKMLVLDGPKWRLEYALTNRCRTDVRAISLSPRSWA